ncbi:MAG: hypothetical protein KDK78_07565, partial [Chlamydiia bacterium]|nr:hypothetical protein [Chlamydiia bacterium]
RPLNCKPLISALQQRLSQLPELELKGPLNFQVLKWLSDVPALSGTLAIHSFDAADIPLLIKYPICAKRLVLPDTSLSPVEAEDLLTAGFPLIQSQDGSLWHQPWRDLPEDLRTTNLLSAMTGEEGERYRLHVALSFLTRAIEHRHSPTGADYDKLLQDNLNEEAVQGAFYLLNNDQKSQAWHSIQSLPHLRRHLIKTVQVSSRGKCFDIPPIALMGLSPRIEEEVRAQGWYWIPNASVSNTQATADLLDYAQHQRIPQAPRQVKDLFILAHHYGVASLLRPCEQRLCDAWFGEKELAYLAQNYPMPLYKERCASLMQGKARSSDAAT